MGLDFVEIVLEAEEAFGISLDDDEVAQVITVGQFSDLISRKISGTKLPGCPTAKAFYQLRGSLVSVLGIPRKNVRPTTSTSALLPYWGRQKFWKHLEQCLALRLPPMDNQAGTGILWSLGIAIPVSFLIGCFALRDPFAAFAASLFSLLPGVLFGYIAGILFLPYAPYPQHRTVGGLAKGLIAYNYDRFISYQVKTLENDDVWNKLCDIFVNQLGVKRERLHREAEFVKDLGF